MKVTGKYRLKMAKMEIFLVLVEIDFEKLPIMAGTELFHKPALPHLASTLYDQRFSLRITLPFHKIPHGKTIHLMLHPLVIFA